MVHVDDAQVSPYDHTYHTQGEKTMRAVIITRPGGHEVLAIQDVEMPEPTGDQVRVRVHAAGLNEQILHKELGTIRLLRVCPQIFLVWNSLALSMLSDPWHASGSLDSA